MKVLNPHDEIQSMIEANEAISNWLDNTKCEIGSIGSQVEVVGEMVAEAVSMSDELFDRLSALNDTLYEASDDPQATDAFREDVAAGLYDFAAKMNVIPMIVSRWAAENGIDLPTTTP